ncbi:MAG TPA: cysteine synthase A, partial [Kofleriaceae bacterium]
YENILQTIGNTPLVRLNRLAPAGVNVFVKVESFNPLGSVKDRMSRAIIEDAERTGALKPGQTVIEATSGNTGIGLAMVCAQKGYPLVVTMAESFSLERRKLLRFLGARVVLTPAAEKGSGMLNKASELAEKHGWFLCRQFENEANADVHSRTTAVEILDAFEGERLDYWVTGYGTGGTLKGVARVLRERSPSTKVVVCEPDNSPLLGSGIAQPLAADGSLLGSHPLFRPHLMQGWSPDFIAKLTADAMAMKLVDHVIAIDGADALRCSRDLAQKEGIFAGITGGATLSGALKIAALAPDGANILCMLPDTGERYLSTPLFADVATDMTDEEIEIAQSTPNYRFDVCAAPSSAAAQPSASEPVAIDPEAAAFVEAAVTDATQPVVMFSFEWCEFCWAVRRMFAAYKIPYRSVDLDAVAYQDGNRGGKIRAALGAKIAVTTIPQIFVGGELIGGCTELLQACKDGGLQQRLSRIGVAYDEAVRTDPFSFLPNWRQPQ